MLVAANAGSSVPHTSFARAGAPAMPAKTKAMSKQKKWTPSGIPTEDCTTKIRRHWTVSAAVSFVRLSTPHSNSDSKRVEWPIAPSA